MKTGGVGMKTCDVSQYTEPLAKLTELARAECRWSTAMVLKVARDIIAEGYDQEVHAAVDLQRWAEKRERERMVRGQPT